jgi:hypothetical protein
MELVLCQRLVHIMDAMLPAMLAFVGGGAEGLSYKFWLRIDLLTRLWVNLHIGGLMPLKVTFILCVTIGNIVG